MAVGTGVAADFVQPGAAGKRLVGLIDHHQATIGAHLGNEAVHHLRVPQIGGGVVGVGQINQRGLVLGNGGLHGGFVQREVSGQGHTDKLQALQARAHGVHDKAGFGGQDGGTGHVAGHGQQCNQFVRSVAQHQGVTGGQINVSGQGLLQVFDALTWVAVDGHRTQALTQRGL